ncbi:alpha/beta fold hydrolase [Pelagibacterium xiamenense]|uniref:alpha/beta fold hydrolase n=1 Tax=Pelagibacterium xiamenense TaxID=2901140 RepID=UPI001E31952C|nr:alpha/beta hydrolase [Pelagibacterium xiamenense]MCD7059836.1 alpha/beta hydrolase [Pelagibacterium xiamenense]
MCRTAIAAAAILAAVPALAQSEPVGAYVDVNGMDMYYEVSGEGDPLIVLHGAHMNIPSMGEIIPALAATHTVYAVELQGHGRTNDIDRPITYGNMAGDVAAFMDAVGLEDADIFGYSMGGAVGLRLAIDNPVKVDQLVAVSGIAFSVEGLQPAYHEFLPQMTVDFFVGTPMEDAYRALSPNPDGYPAFIEKMIALEHEPLDWEEDVAGLEVPVLLIAGDSDVVTLEHTVELFRLLGGGVMGDMGVPLPESRLAVLPATSHTAVIGQTDVLLTFTEQFLNDETPRSFFEE